MAALKKFDPATAKITVKQVNHNITVRLVIWEKDEEFGLGRKVADMFEFPAATKSQGVRMAANRVGKRMESLDEYFHSFEVTFIEPRT